MIIIIKDSLKKGITYKYGSYGKMKYMLRLVQLGILSYVDAAYVTS